MGSDASGFSDCQSLRVLKIVKRSTSLTTAISEGVFTQCHPTSTIWVLILTEAC